MQKVVKRYNFY